MTISSQPFGHGLDPGTEPAQGTPGRKLGESSPSDRNKPPHPFRRDLTQGRFLIDSGLTILALTLTFLALVPLVSVLALVLARGGSMLSLELFTDLPPAAGMPGGGLGNALLGTLILVTIASALAVPIGLMAGIYLAEVASPESSIATVVSFAAKVLSGLPSILAGVFAFAVVVLTTGSFSAWAGGVALAILMIPVITLTTAEALRAVPRKLREAAVGMGATRTQTILQVVLPTASSGIFTGIMLAVSRAAGETAPLLFTALFFDYWPEAPFTTPIASLAVLIYNFSGVPYPSQIDIAWAASLILVVAALIANIAVRVVAAQAPSTQTRR